MLQKFMICGEIFYMTLLLVCVGLRFSAQRISLSVSLKRVIDGPKTIARTQNHTENLIQTFKPIYQTQQLQQRLYQIEMLSVR